ncbi:MAG: tripartite tricarboxylate transporter substrate binding protein [Betaproteobacteria bacterium]|nr:tripartite tricarboxylate transporter substrate binding protein [Betaproteobacteria bacterium]
MSRFGHSCLFRLVVAAVVAAGAGICAAAQPGYPTKPVRVLVGFSPGGATDVAVRIIGKQISETWGQQIVVDNRPGAGGRLAFDIVAKANPDGYTLLATSPSFAIQPGMTTKLPFDPIRDFAPITQMTAAPYVLVLYPGVEAKSVKELIGLAKANPGKLNYASGGIGSAQHLTAELFSLTAGINMVHVPFKGAVSIPDIIAGRVQMVFSGLPQAMSHVQAGRLRAVGVTTPRRSPAMPTVPTIAEAGVPGYEVTVWYGILATGRSPRAVLDKLNAGFVQAIRSAEVRQQLTAMGLEPVGNPSAQFTATVRSEIKQWANVIRRAGIKPGK